MISFLKILFILLIIWYGAKLFFKYVIPWFIVRFINKQQKKYNNQYKNNHSSENKDGIEVEIKKPQKAKSDKPDFGEYVEYEEVDDEKDDKKDAGNDE